MKYVALLTVLALTSAATLVMAAPPAGHQRGAVIERLKAADTNGDGLLSRDEAKALPRLAEHFDAIDANHDNQVSFDELAAARQSHRGQGMLKFLDTDGDGKVSKAEALAAAEKRFDRADANHDGFVTPDEMKAGRHGPRGGK